MKDPLSQPLQMTYVCFMFRKQPSSPQPVRTTVSTLSRSASQDDSSTSGKVVSRAVFKPSSKDSQQVPSYATLPRYGKSEAEVKKKVYEDIDEDPRFGSYGNNLNCSLR